MNEDLKIGFSTTCIHAHHEWETYLARYQCVGMWVLYANAFMFVISQSKLFAILYCFYFVQIEASNQESATQPALSANVKV